MKQIQTIKFKILAYWRERETALMLLLLLLSLLLINTDDIKEGPHYHMFRSMHKIIERCLLSSSSRRWIQSLFQRQISRDVGQPTSYSHPELLASDESEYDNVK